VPVDDRTVTGLLFDWFGAVPLDYEEEGAGAQSAVMLAKPSLLEPWLAAVCRQGTEVVFIAPVAPGYDLVFGESGDDDGDRYDAAEQVIDHVNRAVALGGSDHRREIEVRRCSEVDTDD